jgi:hypothetical protein
LSPQQGTDIARRNGIILQRTPSREHWAPYRAKVGLSQNEMTVTDFREAIGHAKARVEGVIELRLDGVEIGGELFDGFIHRRVSGSWPWTRPGERAWQSAPVENNFNFRSFVVDVSMMIE